MKVLLTGHAYAASYNRQDKLTRIAKKDHVELGVICPSNWQDRMQKVNREYEVEKFDQLYTVFPLKSFLPGSDLKFFYNPLALNSVIKEFNPDLIHIEQEPHSVSLTQMTFLNHFLWNKPLVFFTWENLDWISNPILKHLRRFNLKHTHHAICGNQESEILIKKQGFQKGTTVIPQFGVDEKRFRPLETTSLKKELNLDDHFIIGFVGRYVKEKGIHTLIKSIRLVDQMVEKDFVLMLLSSMSPPGWLMREKDKLGKKVRFLSQIPHEEFPRYMNLFDVLILPSETQERWKEQFGRVMVEAMACGVPVIGSSSGAIPEVVNNPKLIFEEKNSQELAEKISGLISNKQKLNNLKKNARNQVLKNYTHDKVVEKTVQVWHQLIERDLGSTRALSRAGLLTGVMYLDHAPYEGGAEVSLKELLKKINTNTFQLNVVAPSEAPYLNQQVADQIIHYPLNFQWKSYAYLVPLILDLLKLMKLVKKVGPTIVHTNTRVCNVLGGMLFRLRPVFPFLRNIKVINHVRDKDPLANWKFYFIGSCDQIIVNSKSVRDFLVDHGISQETVRVIYNGVELSRFQPQTSDYKLNQPPTLTFIGQIYPRKGLNYLIPAIKQLTRSFPHLKLNVAGEDPSPENIYLNQYKRMAQEFGVEKNINWLGFEEDIPILLSQTDVFVLPSLEEPFGRVIIEAMAMQVPVVATRVGGIPEIVVEGKTGFLVEPGKASALAEKIKNLLENQKLRQDFGTKGKKRVENLFSLQQHVNKIENLYNEII